MEFFSFLISHLSFRALPVPANARKTINDKTTNRETTKLSFLNF